MKRGRLKKKPERIGDVYPSTGEFMLTDGEVARLAKGLRRSSGSPVDPIDAAEFFVEALVRAGLLQVHLHTRRFFKTASAAALDANQWNRAAHQALLDLSNSEVEARPPVKCPANSGAEQGLDRRSQELAR